VRNPLLARRATVALLITSMVPVTAWVQHRAAPWPPVGDMVPIPPGRYEMGSGPAEGSPDERPRHAVTIDRLTIDRTEVTVGAYGACVAAGRCRRPATGLGCNWGSTGRGDHPMNCVTWFEARDYCNARGARLPSEAEWEYAARGSDGRAFPWGGDTPGARACWAGAAPRGGTCVAGSHPDGRTAQGVDDLAGNVAEWTLDPYQADAYSLHDDRGAYEPREGPGLRLRVVRGGGWRASSADALRGATRSRLPVGARNPAVGFRCARGVY